MANDNDNQFYVDLKAFIERDGKVLVLNDTLLGLDFPGGKVQKGETDFLKALEREVREEAGISISVGKPFTVWHYLMPQGPHRNAGKDLFLIGFRCSYTSGEIALSSEHNGYEWVGRDEYEKLYNPNDPHGGYFTALKTYFTRG